MNTFYPKLGNLIISLFSSVLHTNNLGGSVQCLCIMHKYSFHYMFPDLSPTFGILKLYPNICKTGIVT